MFLLVVVLSVHVSFGLCIACPCFFWSYNDQKNHGQTIKRPKETWTDNTTTKRNMDGSMFLLVVVLSVRVSVGRCIVCPCFFLQRPKETWTDNTTTNRNMDRQYNDQKKHGQGRCIVCPCFFWSLYCLSMFLLVFVLSVNVSFDMDRQYNGQKKHGQTIQRPKETWTDNTTTKRNMDRQCNFLLVVVLPVHVSFGRCIACPCFFW
jgi:hypothetical protein